MSSKVANRPSANAKSDVLSKQELQTLNAYWRAANYLSVGQIYHHQYIVKHGDDMPEISGWTWGQRELLNRNSSTESDNIDDKLPAA